MEVLQDVEWKRHRRPIRMGQPIRDNIGLELADATKYLMSMWQEAGFSLAEMLRFVDEKSEMVETRFKQEHRVFEPGSPVLLVDLDGTLADFPTGFLTWLADLSRSGWYGESVPNPDYRSLSIEQVLGQPYHKYWTYKQRFEETGGYGKLPALNDALNFVVRLQSQGWNIVVTTARPASIKRVWHDSWRWLRDNGIEIDRLEMLGTDRVLLAEHYRKKGHPILAMDDDPTIALRLADVCPVLLRDYPYNQHISHPSIFRIGTLEQEMCRRVASSVAKGLVPEWESIEAITSVS